MRRCITVCAMSWTEWTGKTNLLQVVILKRYYFIIYPGSYPGCSCVGSATDINAHCHGHKVELESQPTVALCIKKIRQSLFRLKSGIHKDSVKGNFDSKSLHVAHRVYQITKEPFVYYNCSTPGNRTVHLKVIAEWEQMGSVIHERETVQKTGDFTTALELSGNYRTFCVLKTELAVYVQIQSSLHVTVQPQYCFAHKN